MKTNFRKVVSVVCAIAMLLSLCTVSFINTASAAVLGTTEGSYKDVVKYDFDNATGIGHVRYVDKVKYQDGSVYVKNGTNGGALYFAANPTDGATFTTDKTAAACDLFKLEAGAKYKITLKYKYLAGATDTGFSLFCAKNVDGSSIGDPEEFAGSQSQTVDSNVTKDNPLTADTAWKDYTFEFTPTSSDHCIGIKPVQPDPDINNGRYTAFLIDDVVIQKWNEAETVFADMSDDVRLFGDDKTNDDFRAYGSSKTNVFNKIESNEDGSVTYGITHENLADNIWAVNRDVRDASNNVIKLKKGYEYAITVEYKVIKATDKGSVGFAYNTSGAAGFVQVKPVGYTNYAAGYTSTAWEEYTVYTDSKDLDSMALKLLMAGAGNEIAIKKITVTRADSGYMFVDFNDNGNLTTEIVKIGDATRDGANAYNTTTLKEKFIGWYADPQFTTPVTTYSTDYTTLYAKYPSVVVDFNHRTAYGTEGYGINTTNSNSVADGVYTYTSDDTNVGFILPSYDANIKDAADKNAFYQFKDGYEYKITLVINKNGTACTPTLTPSTNAGKNGGRNQNGEQSYTLINATEEPITVSKVLTFKLPSSTAVSNYQDYNTYTIRHFGNNSVVEFDKIIITQITDMDDYKVGSVSFVDNGKTVKTSTTAGQVIEAPTPAGVDGKLFIGWYEQNYDAYKSGDVSVSSAPVSFAKVGTNEVIYEARYIDASTTTIDFDNYPLISEAWRGYLTNSSASRSKNFKVTADESGNYFLDVKNVGSGAFKTSLFTDDKGTKSVVYEGVRYKVEVDYEVVTTEGDNASDAYITFVHSSINEFRPYDLNFENGSTRLEKFSNAESGRHTVTGYFTAKDLHVAKNGSVEGGANRRESELSLVVSGGYANVYSVKITPVSYTPVFEAKYDSTKGAVQVHIDSDGITGIISAKPAAGYTLAANGVKLVRTYKDYTLSADNKEVTVSAAPFYGLALNTTDGSEFTFDLSKLSADMLRTLRVEVDFVAESEADNAAFIGASIRNQSATVTAGLRFRARISDATVAAAQKIEFVAVPENDLTDCNGLVKDYTGTMSVTGVAYEKGGKNIVYDASIDGFTDYQVCITGLNESAQALKIAVAVKITGADNTVTWIQINNNQSFNGLK